MIRMCRIIGLILELQRFIHSVTVHNSRRKKAEKCYVQYYVLKRKKKIITISIFGMINFNIYIYISYL